MLRPGGAPAPRPPPRALRTPRRSADRATARPRCLVPASTRHSFVQRHHQILPLPLPGHALRYTLFGDAARAHTGTLPGTGFSGLTRPFFPAAPGADDPHQQGTTHTLQQALPTCSGSRVSSSRPGPRRRRAATRATSRAATAPASQGWCRPGASSAPVCAPVPGYRDPENPKTRCRRRH